MPNPAARGRWSGVRAPGDSGRGPRQGHDVVRDAPSAAPWRWGGERCSPGTQVTLSPRICATLASRLHVTSGYGRAHHGSGNCVPRRGQNTDLEYRRQMRRARPSRTSCTARRSRTTSLRGGADAVVPMGNHQTAASSARTVARRAAGVWGANRLENLALLVSISSYCASALARNVLAMLRPPRASAT